MVGHELPGGAVDGGQVQVAAEQNHNHHREHAHHDQRRQQDAVHTEPHVPGDAVRDPRPEGHKKPPRLKTPADTEAVKVMEAGSRGGGRGHVQCSVESPEQHQELDQQVEQEPAVVPLPDTVLHPRTVMVEASHAAVT